MRFQFNEKMKKNEVQELAVTVNAVITVSYRVRLDWSLPSVNLMKVPNIRRFITEDSKFLSD